ncbi:MAG: amino acid-binding protein [Polyangiaceae bacterium]|nr:amino acid-binding protein [Polyangiaceae bacterium]
MKIHQLSLFVENKPGQLVGPCRVLGDQGINILTLNLADTSEFGILRLIVDGWERARDALRAAGYVVNVSEVVAVEVDHRPGGLASLLERVDQAQLAIEYVYAFTHGRGDKAVICLRFDDADAAIAALQKVGVPVVASLDGYGSLGG